MTAKTAKRRNWIVWLLFAALIAALPHLSASKMALAIESQIGIAIIACLSFNILLGQGGMLSFGHAVYSGLGAYATIHLMNYVGEGASSLPISSLPLLGGLFSLTVAAALGFVTTKKAGTTFAMITLGICELVFALSLIIPEFFGGEAGITGNRMVGAKTLGITLGPQIEVYYLIGAYAFLCTLLMYAFTDTPIGRILQAVRDNPERVEFIGFNTQRVRYLGFMAAAFFAGIAGGLAAINFELVTPESVGAGQSGAYLLFTFMGGTTVFYGPIIGAAMMVIATVLLSEWTKAWLLYLGLFFMVVVMFAPGGVASIIEMNVKAARRGLAGKLLVPYLMLAVAALILMAGLFPLIEMIYHSQLEAALTPEMKFMGLVLDTSGKGAWAVCGAVAVAGAAACAYAWKRVETAWDAGHRGTEECVSCGEES